MAPARSWALGAASFRFFAQMWNPNDLFPARPLSPSVAPPALSRPFSCTLAPCRCTTWPAAPLLSATRGLSAPSPGASREPAIIPSFRLLPFFFFFFHAARSRQHFSPHLCSFFHFFRQCPATAPPNFFPPLYSAPHSPCTASARSRAPPRTATAPASLNSASKVFFPVNDAHEYTEFPPNRFYLRVGIQRKVPRSFIVSSSFLIRPGDLHACFSLPARPACRSSTH